MFKHIILITLIFIVMAAAAFASCPHCYRIVKVRVVLDDSRSVTGFFEHHPDYQPVVDSGGKTLIDLTRVVAGNRTPDSIRIFDSVYVFPGLTAASAPEHIRMFATDAVERMYFLEKTDHGGAGSLNIYDLETIGKLGRKPSGRCAVNIDLAEKIVLSYRDDVDDDDLRALVDFHRRYDFNLESALGQFPVRLRRIYRQNKNISVGELTAIAAGETALLAGGLDRIDSLFNGGPLDSHYSNMAGNLTKRLDLIDAFSTYLKSGRSDQYTEQYQTCLASTKRNRPPDKITLGGTAIENLELVVNMAETAYRAMPLENLFDTGILDKLGLLVIVNQAD